MKLAKAARDKALQAALDMLDGAPITVMSGPGSAAARHDQDASITFSRRPNGGPSFDDLPEDPENSGARLVPAAGKFRIGDYWVEASPKCWRSVRSKPDGTEWIPARAMQLDMDVRVTPGEKVRISEVKIDGR